MKTAVTLRLLLVLFSVSVFAQGVTLSPEAKVSVLTCGTGNELYSLFGHTAIRVSDRSTGVDLVYNYGMFDFRTPNFGLKFVKGDMKYFAAATGFADFMMQYDQENRSVVEQELIIPQDRKQALFDKLNMVIFSEDRFYTYKFIDRNCTNMAKDVIDETLGTVLRKRRDTARTYREVIYPYFDGHFYEQLGTSICFGTKTDARATTLFLPAELQYSLAHTAYNGHPLAAPARTLLAARPEMPPFSWWNNKYTFALFLMLVLFVPGRLVKIFYLVLLGALGVFFCLAGWYSLHEELARNYNALLFNPVLIGVAAGFGMGRTKLLRYAILVCAASMVLYLIWMIGKVHLLIVLPVVFTNAVLLTGFWKKSKEDDAGVLNPE